MILKEILTDKSILQIFSPFKLWEGSIPVLSFFFLSSVRGQICSQIEFLWLGGTRVA
nr:MAG TPA: hypothetical protein [Caudoviricetes sp.]